MSACRIRSFWIPVRGAHDGSAAANTHRGSSVARESRTDCVGGLPQTQPPSPLGPLNDFAKDVIVSTPPGTAPIFDRYSLRILTARETRHRAEARATSLMKR